MAVTVNGGTKASWMAKGSASAKVAEKEEQEAAIRKESQGLMWRFWLKAGEEATITFVDGELSKEGFLLPPRFYEHNLYLNGKHNNLFVCPEKTNPASGDKCPICEDPNEKPSLIALFTIIDHRIFSGKDDKQYTDRPKILAAKSQSFEMLNKIASKLGGLAGQTFSVSRSKADKSPAIGDVYLPMSKAPVEELRQKYMVEKTDPITGKKSMSSLFVPADYELEIIYRTGDELRKMGLGSAAHAGMQSYNPDNAGTDSTNYSEHL